ncbi:hypothetical protein [Rhodococcus chondri]|uniref:Cell wall synthesis protein CwsA n=1 Tax=Rhodococcus chondri TaxID=3065941 RepID=A0ABU7JQE5_9NOCA|nr:hypothetical protein [Rhodococcus sp. CC-R104]MEE2032254.1 hypothetical protein [Rhodococcus sp. CC-R104]
MTRVSESSTDSGFCPGLVYPPKESGNLGAALRVAGDGAVALAQGSTAAGLLVTRKGLEFARDVAGPALRARKETALLKSVVSEKPRRRARVGGKALIVVGAIGAIVGGGAVFYRSRRPDHPPIAPEPPRVRPVETGEAPSGH